MIFLKELPVRGGVISPSLLSSSVIDESLIENRSASVVQSILKQQGSPDLSMNLARAAFPFHGEDDGDEMLEEQVEAGNESPLTEVEETLSPIVGKSAAINIPQKSLPQNQPAAVATTTKAVAKQTFKSPVAPLKTLEPPKPLQKLNLDQAASSVDDGIEEKVRNYKEGAYPTFESDARTHSWYENTGQEYYNAPSKTVAIAMNIPGAIARQRPKEQIEQPKEQVARPKGYLPRRPAFNRAQSDAIKAQLLKE